MFYSNNVNLGSPTHAPAAVQRVTALFGLARVRDIQKIQIQGFEHSCNIHIKTNFSKSLEQCAQAIRHTYIDRKTEHIKQRDGYHPRQPLNMCRYILVTCYMQSEQTVMYLRETRKNKTEIFLRN